MKRMMVLFLAMITIACSKSDNSLHSRLETYMYEKSLVGNKIMFYNLDDCMSCQVLFVEKAQQFAETKGVLVLITKHGKKTEVMFGKNIQNISIDNTRLAKDLNLEKGLPVMYIIKSKDLVDSIPISP
jgi:hypothetical protein